MTTDLESEYVVLERTCAAIVALRESLRPVQKIDRVRASLCDVEDEVAQAMTDRAAKLYVKTRPSNAPSPVASVPPQKRRARPLKEQTKMRARAMRRAGASLYEVASSLGATYGQVQLVCSGIKPKKKVKQ